ncbi:MAG: hypothetical protein K2J81_08135 [Treponemataceae bacterium]|nr:hypothetical protein [Treponemataceae bacterium]
MKKRLSKLALLAVAAAFVLVGFPACGDDDDGGEPPAEASATFAGVEIPEGGLALTVGTPQDVTATLTVANTAFSDAVKALEAGADISEYITLTPKVSVADVKVAEKANDATMKITFTVAAEEGAENGSITATLKAAALKDYDKAVAASGSIAYTVKDDSKPDETVYFTSFVASKDLDKAADSTDYETLTSKDGLVTMGRTKYQIVGEPYTTIDYDEETGSGYTYTARVKVNKSNASGTGALTIKSVKVGAILRIDGGNASNGVRKMEITGADESVWAAGAQGTFYLTATASTVVLSSVDNEFCIYGIHVVDKKAAESVVKEDTAYVAPVVTLSETSVVKDSEVTITATIPAATKTTTYSTGRVDSETVPVNADITYNGATVADGKVDTTSEGTLTITASYTVDGEMYTSEAVTLEVTGAFTEQSAEVANNEDTLGLTATEVSSANTDIATAKIEDSKIVITSKSKGNTTITASDGTNTAKIDVTVKADGEIETTVKPYSSATEDSWNLVLKKQGDDYYYGDIKFENTKTLAKGTILQGASKNLNITLSGDKFQINTSKIASDGNLYGVLVKNSPITINSVKGSVTLTVVWGTENKDDRNLTVKIGSKDVISTAATKKNIKNGETEVYTLDFDGADGTDVVIGASNDSFIQSITIEAQK